INFGPITNLRFFSFDKHHKQVKHFDLTGILESSLIYTKLQEYFIEASYPTPTSLGAIKLEKIEEILSDCERMFFPLFFFFVFCQRRM
ncbi:hypothetical protein ACJX0J_007288, partial [Zea mays]